MEKIDYQECPDFATRTGYPEYPYNVLYRSEKDVDRAFQLIVAYKKEFVYETYKIANMPNFAPKYNMGNTRICIILAMNDGDYDTINWLSNMFTENMRVRAQRYDEQMSPFDYFQKNANRITNNFKRRDYQTMSDEIYSKIRGCNTFRANVAKIMIDHYGAKSVLDFSAGWGDRLIGAIATGVRYVGVDPNVGLHNGYAKIIKRFATNPQNYTMICAPFEDAELPVINPSEINAQYETYDMILTSPPYFDLERYSGDDTQSIKRYANIDVWFQMFLMTSIKKAWNALNPNGHMIIVINDAKGRKPYVRSMLEEMERENNAEYLGVISYADRMVSRDNKNQKREYYKSPQPMWIWKKRAV